MYKDILIRLEQIESKLLQQDDDLKGVFLSFWRRIIVPKRENDRILKKK